MQTHYCALKTFINLLKLRSCFRVLIKVEKLQIVFFLMQKYSKICVLEASKLCLFKHV